MISSGNYSDLFVPYKRVGFQGAGKVHRRV